MKIDRLMGILTILLQRDKVTAPELAEKFEVSRRTINRDIDDLCKAGVPVVTLQGAKGGISIAEGYRIDRRILNDEERQAISAGLFGLDSISGDDRYQKLAEKLFKTPDINSGQVLSADSHILIDLASWYKTTLAPKIEILQRSIQQTQTITFTYYSPRGEQVRTIEPYLLIFRWTSWYVWGFCLERESYRLFKLNRMDDLKENNICFKKRHFEMPKLKSFDVFPNTFDAKILIAPEMKWRVVEDFGLDSFWEREDGKLVFSFGFHDQESLFNWVLSLGDQAELLEPEIQRDAFRRHVRKIQDKYENK